MLFIPLLFDFMPKIRGKRNLSDLRCPLRRRNPFHSKNTVKWNLSDWNSHLLKVRICSTNRRGNPIYAKNTGFMKVFGFGCGRKSDRTVLNTTFCRQGSKRINFRTERVMAVSVNEMRSKRPWFTGFILLNIHGISFSLLLFSSLVVNGHEADFVAPILQLEFATWLRFLLELTSRIDFHYALGNLSLKHFIDLQNWTKTQAHWTFQASTSLLLLPKKQSRLAISSIGPFPIINLGQAFRINFPTLLLHRLPASDQWKILWILSETLFLILFII